MSEDKQRRGANPRRGRPLRKDPTLAEVRAKVRQFLRIGYDQSEAALAAKCPRRVVTAVREEWRKEFRKRKEPLPCYLWNEDDHEVKKRRAAIEKTAEEKKSEARLWVLTGNTEGVEKFKAKLSSMPVERSELDGDFTDLDAFRPYPRAMKSFDDETED